MANNQKNDIDFSSIRKKRRRSDRYKETRTRSEIYKDRRASMDDAEEQVITRQEQSIQERQRKNVFRQQEPVEEEWINIPRDNAPVKENRQSEEEYLYDLLNKKREEAEKEEELKEEKPEKKKKEKIKKEEVKEELEEEDTIRPLYRFLIKLGIFATAMILMFTFVVGIYINKGDRMYPFIMDGDVLITLKITPYRDGDVVVYKSPDSGKKEISRIAATGACEVDIVSGIFVVNGDYTETGSLYETYWLEDSPVIFPYDVSADKFFLLDDYRSLGKDSRLFGQIDKKDLKGKVIYVFRIRGI